MMTVGFTRGILFERMMRDSSLLWAGGHGGGGCGPDHGILGNAGGNAGGGGKADNDYKDQGDHHHGWWRERGSNKHRGRDQIRAA